MKYQFVLMMAGVAMLGLTACQPETATTPITTASLPATQHITSAPISSPTLKGMNVRKDHIGGDFTLTGSDGKPFSLGSLKGKVVLLAFGFTNCPDVCPTELLTYREAVAQLGEQAKEVAVVFVSVDFERDTPDLIGRYVKQFHPDFIGLTDTNQGADVAVAKKLYRIVSAKTEVKSKTLYNIDHTSGAYLIDRKGKTVLFEPYGVESKHLADDMKLLLRE